MAKHIPYLISIAVAVVAAAGCASAPSRFYTLNSTATGDGKAAPNLAVLVGPVSVPALVDRPEFAVRVATNRVVLDEFNRWAAPLSDSIARVVTMDLAALLGTPRVATAPLANFDAAYRVTIDVQRFESVRNAANQNEAVLIEAVWTVRRTVGGPARSGHTVAREPAQGTDYAALAAAHSHALAKVSAGIAAAIRSEAGEKP
jgi:uncharacterized protein